jgi:polysaccharide pyruvyl transferase CsaB
MRVLVAGWIGSTNLGDELVFAGLRRLLDDRGVRIAAISTDPDATRAVHGVGAVSHTDPVGLDRAVRQADAVVLGGGGLLQDDTSPFNLPYHLSRVGLARLHRTPYAGIGLGAGGLSTRLGRAQVRRALRGAVAVSVRDEPSRRLLADIGIADTRVAADLAFALDPVEAATRPPDDRLVVCLRPWSGAGTRLPAAMRGDATPDAHVDALATALDRAATETGLAIRFVALQHDRDDAFHRRVAERMTARCTFATPTLDGLLDEVARAASVVSMRYHGGIAAVLAGRPVVLVGYASKVDALAAELGRGARLLGWEPAELATIPEALSSVQGQQDTVREARTRLRGQQGGNGEVLDRLLDHAAGGMRRPGSSPGASGTAPR